MIFDRSLKYQIFHYEKSYENRMITIERLVAGGFLKNNRQMINYFWRSVPRLFRVILSMHNLETLSLMGYELTLTEDVSQLLRSCPKLTELRIRLFYNQRFKMNEVLKNELRSGFQRLKIFELNWDFESWPAIQELFT